MGASLFYRRTEETEAVYAVHGPLQGTIGSVTLQARAGEILEAQIHGVRSTRDYPNPLTPDEESLGLSVDFRYLAWPAVDPVLRVDAIRRDLEVTDPHIVWQAYLSIRVLQ